MKSMERNAETSTAKAHFYEEPCEFPSNNFKRTTLAPLPPSVSKGLHQPSIYVTTTGSTHDRKFHQSPLLQPVYKLAPRSFNVQYVEDAISTLKVKPWRKPLTMGCQSSEMKDKYRGEPEVTLETQFNKRFQPPKLHDHHADGPSKKLVRSTQNEEATGRIYYPKDRGVLSYHGDMYLTTTQRDHRRFNKQDLEEYPKKEYATFWECEEYPKAWGHGSKENPLPRHSVRRSDRPMRDETVFPTATIIPRLPKSLKLVPHSGLTTEVRSNFTDPPAQKKAQLFDCPVARPLHRREAGNEEIFSVRNMYETEYQFIGQKRPAMVA